MAPLTATVAATVAVSLTVAIAQRRRRSKHQQELHRRLGLQPREPLHHGLQRMALGQVDLIIELITADPTPNTVHNTRKAIKRLRALHTLLQHQLPSQELKRNRNTLRLLAQQLSGARDSQVMLATLDSLISSQPRKLGSRPSVRRLRARLLANTNRLQQQALGSPTIRQAIHTELLQLRTRIAAWQLPRRRGLKLVQPALKSIYKQGRNRHKQIRARSGPQTKAMHQWRKSVKDLRYAAEILQRQDAPKPMRPLIQGADSLGELLGQDHDLAVLAQHLRNGARPQGSPAWRTTAKTRKVLLKAIAKRRKVLRKRALRQGSRLYRRPAKRFIGRLPRLS